ncbi:MAG: DndE family protein [Bacteriovoracaceae bacterium]|nr:DndE family protein [Bacteriovoracaceae bacterium]
MITNRIRVSKESTDKMKQLKLRLKVGPLYSIARMALTLSLEEKRPPQLEFYKEDGMEFNRPTLFGEYDSIYTSMLIERGLYKKPKENESPTQVEKLSEKETTSYLVAHINRGMIKLHSRVRNQEDLFDLIKEQNV